MQTTVIAKVQIEGLHRWENAPLSVSWLKDEHHHTFHITAAMPVSHADRDVEIITLAHTIEFFLKHKYGEPVCNFDQMSCEHIAQELVMHFGLRSCSVLEDGRHGAEVHA